MSLVLSQFKTSLKKIQKKERLVNWFKHFLGRDETKGKQLNSSINRKMHRKKNNVT